MFGIALALHDIPVVAFINNRYVLQATRYMIHRTIQQQHTGLLFHTPGTGNRFPLHDPDNIDLSA